MRKKRRLWNLVFPQTPKSIFLIVLSTSKMDCAGISVLPQLGVFSAAGCGMVVSVLQNEIAKIMQNEIAKGHREIPKIRFWESRNARFIRKIEHERFPKNVFGKFLGSFWGIFGVSKSFLGKCRCFWAFIERFKPFWEIFGKGKYRWLRKISRADAKRKR